MWGGGPIVGDLITSGDASNRAVFLLQDDLITGSTCHGLKFVCKATNPMELGCIFM